MSRDSDRSPLSAACGSRAGDSEFDVLVRSGRDDDPPPCFALIADTRSALRIPDAPEIPKEPASDLSSGSSIVERPPDLRVFWVVSVTEQTFPRRRCHTYIHRWVYAFAHAVLVNVYGCDCALLEAGGKDLYKRIGRPTYQCFCRSDPGQKF